MELFAKRPPPEIEILVSGYMRSIMWLYGEIQIPDLIIRICACLYCLPVMWDETFCNANITLNEDKTIATSSRDKPYSWANRTVLITGNYDYKTEQVFKFKISKVSSLYFGMTDITKYNKTNDDEIQSIVNGSVGSGEDMHRVTVNIKHDTEEIISIHIRNGKIQFRINGKQIDYTRRIKKDIQFKIGVTMYQGPNRVEILYD